MEENKTNQIMQSRIHYCFLINNQNNLIPCEACARDFLGMVNTEELGHQISNMMLSETTVTSTISLNHVSYSLKMIPTSVYKLQKDIYSETPSDITHIVVIQNQFLLSELLHKLGKYQAMTKEFEALLDEYDDAIYINKADSEPIYISDRYLMETGLSRNDFFGEDEIGSSPDFFTPSVTPTVMKRKADITSFQHLKNGVDVITTGIPLYFGDGKFDFVVFLASVLSNRDIGPEHILYMKKSTSSQMSGAFITARENIDMVAESPKMKKCMQDAVKLSAFDVPCLLLGSTGCGKEVFASLIHATSRRNIHPFVKINCSAISPTLLESELFGYEAGSFTGALTRGKKGFFETASQGTLLLDEIGDMPLDSQSKLLRVLETGEIYRVGGTQPIKVDVRIIAATNKDLKKMIQEGTFRSDLYYRLNVASIKLPDLKERPEDIPLLINHFSYLYNRKYSTNKVFSDELIEFLSDGGYSWPGNIRELKNCIERLTLLSSSTVLTLDDLAETDIGMNSEEQLDIVIDGLPQLEAAVDLVERTLVTRALAQGRNTRAAADLLGVSQTTIMRKIRKFHLQEEENITE